MLRELHAGGDRLTGVVMWSEVFARCDDPSSAVRWSDLVGVTAAGDEVRPRAVHVNYQSVAAGGCSNTSSGARWSRRLRAAHQHRPHDPQGAVLSFG